ncbi:uncharacterized protein LOC113237039 [Hyposmocoma kahamanoa]|uniref:uncharacterized protein LOC113237039 n=1 Tax=Hyposmocoma kahamanoa TaxID=1477025 RepID=UPI000E6D67E1|nr:uncharacterized protein LOC113237039 [Hyposmocoma kahamanoa]
MKDYAECVFISLVEMRTALLHRAAPERVVSIISDFHFTWSQAVQDTESFKRQIKDTPRDSIITKAVDFTVECAIKRKEYFQQYINSLKDTMTLQEHDLIGMDLKTITDMNINLQSALREKQQTMRNIVDSNEYYHKVLDETEELMNWLDVLNDNLAIQFSRFVGVRFPSSLATDLSKTLQQIIEEVAGSSNQEMMQLKSKSMLNKIGRGYADELEVRKIVEKIKDLENRIVLLKRENSSAVASLQHKSIFLEQQLNMMEDLKQSLSTLKCKRNDDSTQLKSKENTHIFDHLLPKQNRQWLVERLIKQWSNAIVSGLEGKSIISILSVADMKETFCDDLGKFVIDKYGRKLYSSYNEELSFYQVNEKNQLVPMSDDDKHVYFYDDCGRYYINEIKNRVYKSHKDASEYMLNYDGVLVKTKEIRNGIAYYYDSLGRYYLEENGRQVYLGEDGEKYEHDGLGNLIKIYSHIYYETCPRPPIAVEETKYLQQTVGVALKKCIAEVVLRQPQDPILFLAQSLENYRLQEQERQSRREDEVGLMAERRERMRDLESLPTFPCPEGESNDEDYNLLTYNTSFF